MKYFTGTWSVILALVVNVGIVALLFLVIPGEVREKVFRTVEVSISDYRLPEIEEEPPYEPPVNESDTASEGAENASNTSTERGTSSVETGSGGGGASSDRLLSDAMTSFTPERMPHAVKSGPSAVESKLAVDEIMRQMELLDGINAITAPVSGGSKSSLPPGHAVSASFKGRMGKAGRRAALQKHGGDFKSESAVEKALKYLASKQNENGSWGSAESFQTGDAAALSGFALLAFLSHGETVDSKDYGENVRKGVVFLRELTAVKGIENAGKGFGHAILTYALAEAFAMTGDLSLKKPLEERVKAIIARQNKFGSFSENYDNKPTDTPPPSESEDPRWKEILIGEPMCDLSLLGWHIQALTAARNAGISIEKMDESLDKALEALVRIHQAKKGGFSGGINMRRFEADGNLNPVGLLGLQFLNAGKSAAAKRAERLVTPDKKDKLPTWRDAGGFPLYRWYYQTQSIFQNENGHGRTWERWNENMKTEMLANQEKSGAWVLPSGDKSFALRNRDDLSIYATGISALILQVYYRYLPTYSIAEACKADASFADQLEKGIGGYIRRLPGGADPLADLILGIGSQTMKPVQFGAFDNRVQGVETPHIPERFKVYSSFKSTIGVRDVKDWPQTLQPNQRIAVFLDEFLPEDFRNNLMLSMSLTYSPTVYPQTDIPRFEIHLNNQCVYSSAHEGIKNFISILLPKKFLSPSGNILQIRNTSIRVAAFDGAMLGEASLFGPRIFFACDKMENIPNSLRQCFNVYWYSIGNKTSKKELQKKIRDARQDGVLTFLQIIDEIPPFFNEMHFAADVMFGITQKGKNETETLLAQMQRQNRKNKIAVRNASFEYENTPQIIDLPLYDIVKQFFSQIKTSYSPDNCYWGIWGLPGSEKYGNIFQEKYLECTGNEIVKWLWNGGSGIVLTDIMEGGRMYDSSFKTEYPPVAALKQVSKLFDGNPRKIPITIYPPKGKEPLYSATCAAASANAPGVITIVVSKDNHFKEDITLHTLVPWNGKTKMVIERGFFDPGSPYAEQYGTLEREESEIMIENNAFEYSAMFSEMTVIRLTQKFASEPKKSLSSSYETPGINFITIFSESAHPELPKDYDFISLRDSRGYTSVFGKNAAFSVIPASEDTRKVNPFKPSEAESVEVSFTTGNKSIRYDSVFLTLGNGGDDVEAFTFMVYPKCTFSKKGDTLNHAPMTFSFSGKIFRTSFQVNKWQRITVPLSRDVKAPNWGYLRILEPRNILDGRMTGVSYEINHVGLLKKKKQKIRK